MSVRIPTETSTTTVTRIRPNKFYMSGLMVRLLIAFIISWLIIFAFFITNVASR